LFLFEPSSPERFLPVLPFLILTIAAAWGAQGKWAHLLRGVICVFALILPIWNWPSFAGSLSVKDQHALRQLEDFRRSAEPDDVLVSVIMQEPVQQVINDLFSPANRPGRIRTISMINPADAHALYWRERLAQLVLQNWEHGRDVWIMKNAFAARPNPECLWVEGDNPAIRWTDIASFLKTLEFDRATSLPDGFARISRSGSNQAVLTKLAALYR
jgi:hypothetical protein